ncbi:hypothetical protein I3252_11655 [Psychrobacter sp. Ps4]|uniref:hypothetical protein n=1 Tax=Psychrobacter sp. Ps4 TaxID=2790958 RepID=UPI001EDD91CB|nr:hypothetical protein [Psychrobacter sp. Ps4]MCG3810134.1 hypothetical protein [Psychrobacter sp. Ps4]
MLNSIIVSPTVYELKLLEQKAAQHNMYVTEYIAYVLRQALTDNLDSTINNQKNYTADY